MRLRVAAAAMACVATIATAQITDPDRALPIAAIPRPALNRPVEIPLFGTTIRRVTGDAGEPICFPGLPCPDGRSAWGPRATHHGFKDQPWSPDGSTLWLRNSGGGPPHGVPLDTSTWTPRAVCPDYDGLLRGGDDRWHPDRARALVRVGVTGRAPTRLIVYDVAACRLLHDIWIPAEGGFAARGIGDGEGNLSADGRYVFLHDRNRLEGRLVDMRPAGPCPAGTVPSGEMCFGPVTSLACGITGVTCGIGHSTISPSGAYIVVKYSARGPSGPADDLLRVYDTRLGALTLSPRRYAADPPCRATRELPREPGREGYIFRLAHEDIGINPFAGGREHVVGARRMACGDSTMNRVVMVDLESGAATSISMGEPRTEEAPHHVSARAVGRPGWVHVTYRSDTRCPGPAGCRFRDEVVAFRMEGGDRRACERYGHVRSDLDAVPGDDDDEGQAVPSPDGTRILFRSTWSRADACAGPLACGPAGQVNAYVLEPLPRVPGKPAP